MIVTVATEEAPPDTELGFNASVDRSNGLAVTVRTFVTGNWPWALTLIVTAVVCATKFAASRVPAARPVQPAMTLGWPTTATIAGWLLVTVIALAVTGARVSTRSRLDPCPGSMVEGVSVKDLIVDGNWVPPGLSVSTEGTETRLRLRPVAASGYEISKCKGTAACAVTTEVGRSKFNELTSAVSNSGTSHNGGTSDPVPPRLTTA